jgi:hypothetical protein
VAVAPGCDTVTDIPGCDLVAPIDTIPGTILDIADVDMLPAILALNSLIILVATVDVDIDPSIDAVISLIILAAAVDVVVAAEIDAAKTDPYRCWIAGSPSIHFASGVVLMDCTVLASPPIHITRAVVIFNTRKPDLCKFYSSRDSSYISLQIVFATPQPTGFQ